MLASTPSRVAPSVGRDTSACALAEPPALVPPIATRYDRVAITLHWLMAVLLVVQLVLGWWMLGLPKQPPGLRAGWFNLHKSIGIVLGVVIVLRLAWRLRHRPPAWAASMSAWQQRAAGLTHGLLYAALVVMPLSGFIGSSLGHYPVQFFGMALPRWAPEWPAAKTFLSAVHLASGWLLLVLLIGHVTAALLHALRRDGVMARMLPPLHTRTP